MLWSRAMIPTLRDDPQEAEIPSHKLMLRAGLIRKLAGGLYTFLPLGLRALRKVEAIVREEMDRAGALEVLMPALQPRDIWERSQRYEGMADVMFRVRDHQDRDWVLGPTHEEVVTELVSREVRSYRDLPRTLYQIQTKFRDEIRPRFGLMRAKEFLMKDAYSFDASWDAADASYQAMYRAYGRIFDRCGLTAKVVEADTGAMGGDWSHEFMVLAETGEDGIVDCDSCRYAANLERAERAAPAPRLFADRDRPPQEVLTPACRTIEEVSRFLDSPPERLVKTLIYIADGKPTAVLIPGDRDLNEHKLLRCIKARSLALADDAAIQSATGAPVGFAGPVGLAIPVIADFALKGSAGLITGANRADTHLLNVDIARDANVLAYHDLCVARDGDMCPRCGGRLTERRGIEVGHVFKLGTKYTDAFQASYLDDAGQRVPIVMGCYGIGVTRTLQAVIEQHHDANGILWPMAVAPYRVVVLPLNARHEHSLAVAAQIAARIEESGVDVLLDDRDERPGVKFKDADLLGFPVRIVVSERTLAGGEVEIKRRTDAAAQRVAIADAASRTSELAALASRRTGS